MPRGQPDFGMYAEETYVGSVSDMAELAARLGSIVIFDRRGKILDIDDCEGTVFRFWENIVGDGDAVFDTNNPKMGSECVKLTSGTGRANNVAIEKGFVPLLSKSLGIKVAFSKPHTDTFLDLILTLLDGTESHTAKLRLDFNARTISYWAGGANYPEILTTSVFDTGAFVYYPIKLVADIETGKFVRLLWAGKEYDLSSYDLVVADDPGVPLLRFTAILTRRDNDGGDIWLDAFILTQDEP